jgi:membrane protein YqaA with SNARE-associated domain
MVAATMGCNAFDTNFDFMQDLAEIYCANQKLELRIPLPCLFGGAWLLILSVHDEALTLPSGSVSHNWLWFVVVVAVGKLESVFCFPTFP